MTALSIYAGPKARRLIEREGLQPHHIRAVAGAAGGPKGLSLLGLDKFIFGQWLAKSNQRVDLVGASIGAWRMATACLSHAPEMFDKLGDAYIAQDYKMEAGKRWPSAKSVSDEFAVILKQFFGNQLEALLAHPRYKLHILTSRGRGFLRQTKADQRFEARTVLGFMAGYFANLVSRKAMGSVMQRVVFSNDAALPFATNDYATALASLKAGNFEQALLASCSIPFILSGVNGLSGMSNSGVTDSGLEASTFWDGGLTDYHAHMDYASVLRDDEIVLIPHFGQHLVAGWLDKKLKWRHKSTAFLDNVVVLAPSARFIASLPNAKLPDRDDFKRYAQDAPTRQKIWRQCVNQCEQLPLEFAAWLDNPNLHLIQDL